MRRTLGAMLALAGLASTSHAAECTPQELMVKVERTTALLERQMQQPAGARRRTAASMRVFMARHPTQRVTDYQGVCSAYDDLIEQLNH